MNYNIITYIIFLPIIFFITIKVGWVFYKNGELFLSELLINNPYLVKSVNKLLLIGYYLINLGYSVITISFWQNIESSIELVDSIAERLGKLIILLAILHYNNLIWLKYLTKRKILK